MNNFIILFCISVFSFVLITFFAHLILRKNDNKFSILNTLPCETFLHGNNYKITALKLLYVVPFLLLIFASFNVLTLNEKDIYTGIIPVSIALLIISSISFCLLLFLNPKKIHLYIFFFILLFVCTVMNYFVNVYVGITSFRDLTLSTIDIKKLVLAIISGLLLITYIIVFSKSKALLDFKLTRKEKEDGTVELVRPKYFPLAFFQWAGVISTYLTILIIFLQFI